MHKKRGIEYHFWEFVRYSIAGTTATILNLLIIYLLTDSLHIYYVGSGVAAYIISGTYNFVLNKVWTFREKLHHKIIIKYSGFLTLNIGALFANALLLYIYTDVFGLYYVFSQFFAILSIALINYVINKFIIFKK